MLPVLTRKMAAPSGIAKVLVVGDIATGKTSVIKRYVRNQFSSEHKTTIGVDFALKKVHVDGSDLNVQLWDIAGQERFCGLSRIFYTHAVAAIVVFDLFQRDTFENALKWKRDIDAKVFLPSGRNIPVILVGNKCDLKDEGKTPVASDEEIEAFAKEHKFYATYQCSAKTGQNVKQTCLNLIEEVARCNKREAELSAQQAAEQEEAKSVKLTSQPVAQESGGCC